ncbi:MAG: bifunctional hydroxymethylpyrimidine kinase/phosphomethylpyrimidine kinase [bacterium]|nr:bifunctional hydroxymethylpyrimidine kinase/phosphomethylpyrimidine kinase [Candidatus Colisoma equi]
MKRLLTIQDLSCVGQCSTTVALPLVSACGVECAVLPPAMLSNHTASGFKGWSFCDLTDEMAKVESKWVGQGIAFDAFYTGYVCEQHIDPILSIMRTCAAPGAIRIVDPAMADDGALYRGFAADFPSKMLRLCKGADYLLPNLTEAALLTGEDPARFGAGTSRPRKEDIERIIVALHGIGVKTVVLTGVSFNEAELGTAVSNGESIKYDFNPRNPRNSHGTGDVFASVFAGAVLRGKSAVEAAALAADIVCASIEATASDHWYGVSFEKVIPDLIDALR